MENEQEKERLANSITKAIAYAENGGKPNIDNPSAGQSGEMKSIFQFTPATWKGYSKEVFGKETPLNADTEAYVVNEKVKKWIDKGHTASEIASMWNAGEGRPNAYKENWKGVNKYGVKYDTPAYAKKVLEYSTKFYTSTPQVATAPQEQAPIAQAPTQSIEKKPVVAKVETATVKAGDINKGVLKSKPLSRNELKRKLPGLFKGNAKTTA